MNNPFDGMTYEQSANYQLEQWVKGNPLHNPIGDECCPDFSCCNPELLIPEEVLQKFKQAHETCDDETKMQILGIAISGLAAINNATVYVSGINSGTA